MHSKEYYIEKWQEAYKRYEQSELKENPDALFMASTSTSLDDDRFGWDKEVTVGYFLEIHGKDALSDWNDRMAMLDRAPTDIEYEIGKVLEAFEKGMTVAVNNIKWDVDFETLAEAVQEMSETKASELLGVPYREYVNMTQSEQNDYLYECLHHLGQTNDDLIADIMKLPREVVVPKEYCEYDEYGHPDLNAVTDWLSDEYSYCVRGYDHENIPIDEAEKVWEEAQQKEVEERDDI